MSKKILSMLLVLAMLVGIVAVMPMTVGAAGETGTDTWDGASTATGFAGGNGTELDPFEIATCAQWIYFANNATDAYYELVSDLDFNGKNIPPVQRSSGFEGVFNGNGHTIKGVAMKNENSKYDWGLFGKTTGDNTQIRNLVISSSTFTYDDNSGGWSGGLVGEITGGNLTIENVYIDKDVLITSTKNCVGGFVGGIDGGVSITINDSVFAGAVNQSTYQNGGFIGNGSGSALITFNDCLFIGRVGEITNFNAANETVSVVNGMAGFLGYGKASGSSINNCVFAGTAYNSFMSTKSAGTPTNFALNNSFYTSTTGGVGASDKGTNTEIEKVRDVVAPYVTDEIMSVLTGWTVRDNDIIVPSGVADFAPSWYVAPNIVEWDVDSDGAYVIKTVAQWNYLAEQVNDKKNTLSGKTVKLGADIDFGGNGVSRIGNDGNHFAGTFDGQGHVISGVYMAASAKDWGFGLIGATDGEAVVKNLVLTNSNFEYTGQASWGAAVVGEIYGTSLTMSNVFVTDTVTITATGGGCVGGLIGGLNDGTTANVSNCVFAGTITSNQDGIGGIIGAAGANDIEISNCLFAGEITSTATNVGGIAGGKTNSASVISNCISVGTVVNAIICGQDGTDSETRNDGAVISNCYYIGDRAVNPKYEKEGNTYYALTYVEDIVGTDCDISIDGWTKRDGDYMLPTAIVTMFTESGAAIPQLYIAPVLEGEGTELNPYKIASAENWKTFVYLARLGNTFAGQYVVLTNDIDFDGVELTPLKGFAGTLDGKEKTLSNISMSGSGDVALFCGLGDNATIKNLVIKSSTFEIKGEGNWLGTVACCTNCKNVTISNIYVDKDVKVISNTTHDNSIAGGVLGGVYGSGEVTVTDCVFAGTVTGTGDYVAGIVGNAQAGTTTEVSNCLNTGRIYSKGNYVAGIAVSGGITINDCVNAGVVSSGSNYVGGIYAGNPTNDVIITNCYAVGSIEGHNTDNGGAVTVSNCVANLELNDLTGMSAEAPSTFTKRYGDFAIPTNCTAAEGVLLCGLTLLDGASVRFSDPSGIRFTAVLSKAYLDSFGGDNVTFGIIIAPTDYVTTAGAFTIDALETLDVTGLKYVIIEAEKYLNDSANDESYLYTGALVELQKGNYNRDFSAIAYVLVDGVYYYSDYDESYNARSIAEVAEKAYKDTSLTQNDHYQYLLDDGLTTDEAVYSPYTKTQRQTLLGFYNPEGAIDVSFLSYNIRNVEDTSGWLDRPTYEYDDRNLYVRDYLVNYDADVIGLQEASWLKATIGTLDWFDTLGDADTTAGLTAAGYTCVKGEDLYGGKNSEKKMYNPIYYKTDKYDFVASGTKWLTRSPDTPSTIDGADTTKALNYVVLEDKSSGQQFVYVNLHLIVRRTNYVHDADGNDTDFYVQQLEVIYLRKILQELQNEYAELPMFVGGDFNNSYSSINGWFKKSVVGENDWDINSEGTPEETIKLSIARDQAVCTAPKCYSVTSEDFTQINPEAIEEGWGAIDLWFTSNLDGIVYVYQIIDNKTTTTTGEKYPSDHLPARMYVTIYK